MTSIDEHVLVPSTRPPSPSPDRYQALVRAAQQIFAAKGYTAASTEQIALAAGVSKSLVFRHFGTKASLFASSVIEPLAAFLSEFSAEWDSPQWSESDLETITTHFVTTLYDRMRDFRPLLVALLSVTLQDQPGAELDLLRDRLGELFARTTAEHVKACERFGIESFDPQLTVRITFGVVFAMVVLDDWLLDTMPRRPSRRRVLAELSAFVTAAVRPRAAYSEPHATSSNLVPVDPPPSTPPGRRARGTAPGDMLAAAAATFAENGYAATSTKEIAERAGVAESLLFFHFPTKEDLYIHAVFEPFIDTIESFTGDWDRTEWQSHPIQDTTRAFILKIDEWMHADRALLIAMIHSTILDDEAGPSLPQARTQFRRLFDRIEIEHLKAREFHGLPPRDTPLTIRATFGAILAITVLDQWLLTAINPPASREHVQHELIGYLAAATLRIP